MYSVISRTLEKRTAVYSVFYVLFTEEKSGRASGSGNEKFVRSNDVLMRQRASCAEEGVDGRPVAPSSFLPSSPDDE